MVSKLLTFDFTYQKTLVDTKIMFLGQLDDKLSRVPAFAKNLAAKFSDKCVIVPPGLLTSFAMPSPCSSTAFGFTSAE